MSETVPLLQRSLAGLLPARAAGALRRSGVQHVGDLLRRFPRRYIDPGEITDLSSLEVGVEATIQGRIVQAGSRRMQSRRGHLTEVVLGDDSGEEIAVTFFNQPWIPTKLTGRESMVVSGKVGEYRGGLQLASPRWLDAPAELEDAEGLDDVVRPIPLYSALGDVHATTVTNAIGTLVDLLEVEDPDDPLPEEVRSRGGYAPLGTALRMVHRPSDLAEAHRGLARFRFEEAFVLQTVLAQRRAVARARAAVPRAERSDGALAAVDAARPFPLTGAQARVGEEIAADLSGTVPMNRLLHGEVGSGKTLVALRAMLQVVDAGGQAVLLAPTEVLAAQHHASISAQLAEVPNIRVALLTGSAPVAVKKRALLDIVTGEADIVIATHAVLQSGVGFFSLGLVVVDEQHRFGVDQRDALRDRADGDAPHTLVMTATPIPRTVAMTVFGDLDTSVLDELPAGRRDIAAHAVALGSHPHWMDRVWQRLGELVDAGRQVYIVVPRIGDGEGEVVEPADISEQRWDIESARAAVVARSEFSGRTVDILHGRLSTEDKAAAMASFAAGDTDVLVATTVIEVGVDVHNATGMLVLDAERFGIAQLHQIRGRVGRGGHAGLCFFVTGLEDDHPAAERLAQVAATEDGFALAELDVATRREGDVLGRDQSGRRSALKLLHVIDDARILGRAREEARALVAEDPDLQDHPHLAALAAAMVSGDQEQYIELA